MTTFHPKAFPLFKGCTRLPMVMGVPLIPLIFMLITVASIASLVSLWWWFLIIPSWFVMQQICKSDDKAFRILGLWIETKLHNQHKDFWGASSYTPHLYKWKKR